MTRPVEIRIDQTGNAQQGISNISTGLTGLGAAAAAASVAAVAAIAAIGIAAGKAAFEFGKEAIEMGADAIEMQSKFDVVFGDLAESSAKWLDQLAKDTGRSKFALREMAASLQDTFVPLGFARDEAAKLSLTMTQLAIDVGSFNNIASEDVMRDFQSAIVGNTETVRKYGIVITQATLDQELLNMGIEGGVASATEQEKALARMNIILRQTSDAQGDAIRTSDSWANMMVRLTSKADDLKTMIGLSLIPIFQPLAEKIVTFVDTEGQNLLDWLASPEFADFSNFLSQELVRDFDNLINNGLNPFIEAIGIKLPKNTDDAKNAITAFGDYLASDEFRNAVETAGKQILAFSETMKDVQFLINLLNPKVEEGKTSWLDYANAVIRVTNPFVILGDTVKIMLQSIGDGIRNARIMAENGGSDIWGAFSEGFRKGFEKHAEEMRQRYSTMVQSIVDRVKSLLGISSPSKVMMSIGSDTMQGLLDGLRSKWSELLELARQIANSVANTISNALKIKSPSKVTEYLGEMTGEGFKVGMEKSAGQMMSTESKFMPTININNPVVRNDNDITNLAKQVQFEIAKQSNTYRGGYASQTV